MEIVTAFWQILLFIILLGIAIFVLGFAVASTIVVIRSAIRRSTVPARGYEGVAGVPGPPGPQGPKGDKGDPATPPWGIPVVEDDVRG